MRKFTTRIYTKANYLLNCGRMALSNQRGDFYISDAVKIIIAVVLGALLLAALTLIFNDTPGFCYHDRSGWRAYPQTYMTMQCPLWIIAEDAATGRRLWITQEGTRFSISIRRMDEQRRNYGPTYRITCENRTKLAQVLRYQFESKTLAV